MKDPKSSEALGTLSLIEKQMLLYNARCRLVRENPAAEMPGPYRFITISRDIGALGDFVASELATRLSWHVFEKEIVDYIAKHSHVRQDLVRQMDERGQSLVHDTVERLLRMFQGGSFGNEEYHAALLKTLATLAAQGGAILVGHGGAFALQGQPGLHVRITASPAVRIERLGQRWMVSSEETRKRVQQVDEQRRQFVLYHFKVNREDHRFFDMIFNTDHIGVEQVALSILGALQHPEKVQTTPVRPPFPERDAASTPRETGS